MELQLAPVFCGLFGVNGEGIPPLPRGDVQSVCGVGILLFSGRDLILSVLTGPMEKTDRRACGRRERIRGWCEECFALLRLRALAVRPPLSPSWPTVLRQYSIRPVFSMTSSGCSPFVSVILSSNFCDLDHRSQLRRLLRPRLRRILGEREMGVIGDHIRKNASICGAIGPRLEQLTLSKHSRRIEPINLSTNGFCHRHLAAVMPSSIFIPAIRRRNSSPYIWSRSPKRKHGAVPSGNASMICCAVQAAVGCSVRLK